MTRGQLVVRTPSTRYKYKYLGTVPGSETSLNVILNSQYVQGMT